MTVGNVGCNGAAVLTDAADALSDVDWQLGLADEQAGPSSPPRSLTGSPTLR